MSNLVSPLVLMLLIGMMVVAVLWCMYRAIITDL